MNESIFDEVSLERYNYRTNKVKFLNNKIKRQIKGSKNYYKTKKRIAAINRKLSSTRKQYILQIKDILDEIDC